VSSRFLDSDPVLCRYQSLRLYLLCRNHLDASPKVVARRGLHHHLYLRKELLYNLLYRMLELRRSRLFHTLVEEHIRPYHKLEAHTLVVHTPHS